MICLLFTFVNHVFKLLGLTCEFLNVAFTRRFVQIKMAHEVGADLAAYAKLDPQEELAQE